MHTALTPATNTFLTVGKMKIEKKQVITFVALTLICVFMASVALAYSAPAKGDPGYTVYDILVNKMIKGPIGSSGGVFLMALGATMINQSWVKGGATALSGGIVFNADAVATSFGMMLPF